MITLPSQNNYAIALERAWARLSQRLPDELEGLGAISRDRAGHLWNLPVLDGLFAIDTVGRSITLAGGSQPGLSWQILALHYLLAKLPIPRAVQEISFEQIPGASGYSGPYSGRVVNLFCRTVGRNRESVLAAAAALQAELTPAGDVAFRLRVFPHVSLTIVWYAGDEELAPGASFLYEDRIAALLDVEDIVVMAERVVSRLRGKPW